MSARPALLRTLAIAAIASLLAACGNPTGPATQPTQASLGIYQSGSN